uniref:Uncharacterized protein n=1 Tax=Rheinheimera sp. BAL341 TaxID=1708203 RepID=A0A486XH58_9GAMM
MRGAKDSIINPIFAPSNQALPYRLQGRCRQQVFSIFLT